MTNNQPTGYHREQPMGIKLQATGIALSKVCNVNNTIILEQNIVVFYLVATAHLQP
jgi:hypothetical protein